MHLLLPIIVLTSLYHISFGCIPKGRHKSYELYMNWLIFDNIFQYQPDLLYLHLNFKASTPQNWYNLKLPFAVNPLVGFYDQPRTIAEADKAGWSKLDESLDCKGVNGGR